jgi:hypothetical protein
VTPKPIPWHDDPLLGRAMDAAEDAIVRLQAVPDHSAAAMGACGRQRLDRAFEAIEDVRCALGRGPRTPCRSRSRRLGKPAAGDEGFRVGGWVGLIKDRPELGKLALDESLGSEALLLGRRTYEWQSASTYPCAITSP